MSSAAGTPRAKSRKDRDAARPGTRPDGPSPQLTYQTRTNGQRAAAAVSISYEPPSLEHHRQRVPRKSTSSPQPGRLPNGWPQRLSGRRVWTGKDYADEGRYVVNLSASEVAEVRSALRNVKESGLGFDQISQRTFLLPNLGAKLDQLRERLNNGPGFFVLRGFSLSNMSDEETLLMYLGVSKYIARDTGRQNVRGLKNVHVTDVKIGQGRGPVYSNASMAFHTDVICGVLGMFYVDIAQQGGELLLASAWKLYNEIAATYPDMISLLASRDWPLENPNQVPSFHKRALLHLSDGNKPILNFSRRLLTGSDMEPRSKDIPRLSDQQYDAINELHHVAKEHYLKVSIRAGDMCFINNFAVLHGRNGFKDGIGHSKRHALRLWLNDPKSGWKVPPGLQAEWRPLFEPSTGAEDVWHPKAPSTRAEVATDSTKCG